MADLDQLKSINDAYGYDSGEAVLKKFAEILRANTRQCDLCGRIGGDEFVLVITHSKEDGVRLAIERLREQVEAQRATFGGQDVVITASFGMAGLHRGAHLDFGRLLVQADVALHSAKRLGRNRVEIVPAEVH
jgi:diguanylate cyclase (GGDEF)-like protein